MTQTSNTNAERELDVRGAKCPMPIIKARQELNTLTTGQLLKVFATDPGSVNDFKGWVKTAKNIELAGQETVTENGTTVYVHLVRKLN